MCGNVISRKQRTGIGSPGRTLELIMVLVTSSKPWIVCPDDKAVAACPNAPQNTGKTSFCARFLMDSMGKQLLNKMDAQ
jgi:hypothetical protein